MRGHLKAMVLMSICRVRELKKTSHSYDYYPPGEALLVPVVGHQQLQPNTSNSSAAGLDT
jgi:hypothetical protein